MDLHHIVRCASLKKGYMDPIMKVSNQFKADQDRLDMTTGGNVGDVACISACTYSVDVISLCLQSECYFLCKCVEKPP